MSYDTLIWEREGAAVTVTLNRPELFNAFNETMAGELLEAIDQVGADPSIRALELVYLGESVDALRAERLGLVTEIVDADKLAGRARELTLRLAAGPTVALGQAKRALHAATMLSYEEALAAEAVIQDVAGATADNREGLAAFLEKRRPVFQGR